MQGIERYSGGGDLLRVLGMPPNFADGEIQSIKISAEDGPCTANMLIKVPIYGPTDFAVISIELENVINVHLERLDNQSIISELYLDVNETGLEITIEATIGVSGVIRSSYAVFEVTRNTET